MAGGMYRGAAFGRATAMETERGQLAKYEQERKRRMEETSPMREYEAAIMGRGKMALEGKYNVAEDPQVRAIRAGLAKSQRQSLSDLESTSAKSGLPGFSANYLSEKMKETGASTILNLAAAMEGKQGEMITAGETAGKNIYSMLSPEQQFEMSLRGNFAQGETAASMGAMQASMEQQTAKKAQQQSGFNSVCCYIFYAGNKFIRAVHMFRDEFYPNEGFVGLGYRLMASWLVPIMKRNNFIKKLVIFIMLDPLAKYAMAYYQRQVWKKFILTPFKLFWPNVWVAYGRTALAYEKMALRLGV